jgi:hypothetical protein
VARAALGQVIRGIFCGQSGTGISHTWDRLWPERHWDKSYVGYLAARAAQGQVIRGISCCQSGTGSSHTGDLLWPERHWQVIRGISCGQSGTGTSHTWDLLWPEQPWDKSYVGSLVARAALRQVIRGISYGQGRHWGKFPPRTSVSLATHSFH